MTVFLLCSFFFDQFFDYLFLARPHSTNVPTQSSVVETNDISITCTTIAKPEANILWFDKNNKQLSNDVDYSIVKTSLGKVASETKVQSVLRIKTAEIKDAGNYRCRPVNAIATDEAVTVLTVYCK